MMRTRAGLLGIAALLAACTHHAGEPAATTPPSAVAAKPAIYPAGIVAPADWAGAMRAGIYASDDAKTCCFLGPASTLTLENPLGAQYAVFTFYVPPVAPLTKTRERVTARFNGVGVTTATLSPGMQNVNFAIPAPLRQTRHIAAALRMSIRWVPKDIGLNQDRRALSVMLIRVGYI
jgi:hypothetical protein